jgi:hypothetical protein
LGFSSLASSVLIHVVKTHKLETKGVTREFYLYRIFPLGFLMVRAPAPAPRLAAQSALRPAGNGADAPATQAATLGFGNLAYLYLSVSFIQILKAATPVMTMCILVAARLDKLSTPVRR